MDRETNPCGCDEENVCAECSLRADLRRIEDEKKLDAELAAFDRERRKFRGTAGTAGFGDTYGWNGQPTNPPAWRF